MFGGLSLIPQIAQLSISLFGTGVVFVDFGLGSCGFVGKLHGFRLFRNFAGA